MTIYDDMAGKYAPGGSAISQTPFKGAVNTNNVNLDSAGHIAAYSTYNMKVTKVTVPMTMTGTVAFPLATLPVGAFIYDIAINVTSAFNGSATFDIGYAGSIGAYVPTATVIPASTGLKENAAQPVAYVDTTAHGAVIATVSQTSGTTGSADVYIVWFTA